MRWVKCRLDPPLYRQGVPRPRELVSQLNIGNIDRAVRILVGLILVALAGFGQIGIWGYIGVILIATGMIAICPLYSLLGVRTTSR